MFDSQFIQSEDRDENEIINQKYKPVNIGNHVKVFKMNEPGRTLRRTRKTWKETLNPKMET